MILTIVKLRFLQFFRLLKEIGLFLTIILSAILGIVSVMSFNYLISPKNTSIVLIAIGLLLISTHTIRKDKCFIKSIINNPYLIYLSEYFLFTLPFILIWLFNNNWIGLGVIITIVGIIPLTSVQINFKCFNPVITWLSNIFNSNINSKFNNCLLFISDNSFEWKSGIRRNLFLLAPAYLIILALSFKPFIAVAGLVFLSLFLSSFYFYGESKEFITLFANNPKEFILKKIMTNFRQLSILNAPILAIALLFQVSTWYYLLGALIVSLFIQVFAIVYKYGLFEENTKLNRHKYFFYLLCSLIVMPHIFFVPVIWGIKSYMKALNNLKQYFND